MKFFLDTNILYSALEVFLEFNLEVVHARDVGLSRAEDKEIMIYARRNKSIVNHKSFSLRNFCSLLYLQQEIPLKTFLVGDILITKDLGFGNILLFPIVSDYGVVILRLPPFFKASQLVKVIRDFLSSIDVNVLVKSIAIVKLGKYRIRKFK